MSKVKSFTERMRKIQYNIGKHQTVIDDLLQRLHWETDQTKRDGIIHAYERLVNTPKHNGLKLVVDNVGVKIHVRKGKKSFSEEQADNWLKRQGKQDLSKVIF